MIRKIVIENFRGIRNKMEINFIANSKRKSNGKGIEKKSKGEVLLASSLISKNASGKTSFIEGIIFMNSLNQGDAYNNLMWSLKLKNNNKEKTDKIDYSVSKELVIDYFVSKEFNNEKKDIRFVLESIDNNHIVKLEIKISNRGMVNEKITLDNKVFSSKNEHLQKFKSNIFNEDLKIERVGFLSSSNQLSEIMILESNLFFEYTEKYPKELLIEWMTIADPKIVKGIWSSKNLLENLILKFNDEKEKKISLNELSSGSKKWYDMFFKIMKALLTKQTFLIFDELERSLHHSLASFVLKLFNDPKINKMKSQLFFTTHSPLLVDEMERKDSINYIDSIGNVINMGNDLKLREDLKVTKNFLTQELGSHPKMSSAYYFMKKLI